MEKIEGHPSGFLIIVILAYVVIFILILYIFTAWLTVSTVFLLKSIKEYRKTDKSDRDSLKKYRKKIIFHSVMVFIPLAFLFCSVTLREFL